MLRNPRLFKAESSVLELHTNFDPFPKGVKAEVLSFSFTRVVLHSLLSFQAPALTTIMVFQLWSSSLQFLISSQSQVPQVSNPSSYIPLGTSCLNSLFSLLKWPYPIFPVDLSSLASPPSQIFVLYFSSQGPCLSVLTQMNSSPNILGPH